MSVNSDFGRLVAPNSSIEVISYDTSWEGTTGYLNHAVTQDLGLKPGEMRRGIDVRNRRAFLIIATRFGNVIIFERFAQRDHDFLVPIVFNAPHQVESMFTAGRQLDESVFTILTGGLCGGLNVGKKIEKLFEIFKAGT